MNVYFVINVIIVTEPLTNAFYSNYIVPGVLSCIVCCINIIITLVQHHSFWCFTDILYWFYCICLFVCSTCLTSVILLVCEMAGSIPGSRLGRVWSELRSALFWGVGGRVFQSFGKQEVPGSNPGVAESVGQ